MIPSSGCPLWPPDHPRTRPRTGTPTPLPGARPGAARPRPPGSYRTADHGPVLPVLGADVVEGEQRIAVLHQARDRLVVLDPVVTGPIHDSIPVTPVTPACLL